MASKRQFIYMQKRVPKGKDEGSIKPFERLPATCTTNMDRGQRGPVDQSQKKPKIGKDKERGEMQWWHFGLPNDDKKSLFLPDDAVDAMKRMDPREVVNILLSKERLCRFG